MVSVTGLGSGLDIKSIVEASVAAERAPKEAQLARLEKSSTAKFTALGSLKGALNEFQTALKDLSKASLFGNRTATSSSSDIIRASASKDASDGVYQVKVEHLATASKVTTAGVGAEFTSGSGGSLTLRLGSGDNFPVTVNVDVGKSLSDIRDALNTSLAGKGVTANIVNNPASGKSQLVLSAKETGAGKDIYLEGAGGLAELSIDPGVAAQPDQGVAGAGWLARAENAKFSIDGLMLESATNTIENAIPNVGFSLLSADPGKSVTVKVGQDIAGVTSSLKKFVDSYNKLISTTDSLTRVTKIEGGEPITGDLVGDSTIRGLLSSVRKELTSAQSGQDGLRMLTDLGISTQRDGKLAIDDTKLKSALENNFDAVGGFLAGDKGLMSRLSGRLNVYVQADGILDQRMKGQRSVLDSVKTQRSALDQRVASIQARLYAQYNAMDSLVGQLTRTSDWMVGAFESLPGVAKKK